MGSSEHLFIMDTAKKQMVDGVPRLFSNPMGNSK
jgi:hypothetical protein